jgi:ATP-dependent DNA ligase
LVGGTQVRRLSRGGRHDQRPDAKRFRHLLDGLPYDCVFDGEICVLDSDGRPQFNDLLFGRGDPVYVVFDLLFYEREDIRSLPLKERRAILDHVARRFARIAKGLKVDPWKLLKDD